jgi:phthiodiolone/phenolphthiodiolone dimycocerosates ketoreductase
VTTPRTPEVAAIVWGDRNQPASLVASQAKALEQSGAVDTILFTDQLVNLIPPQLWKPEHTQMAEVLADPDSHPDPFVMSAYASAAAPTLKMAISTDCVRHGPAELMQTMLTLANVTEGKSAFHVGAGEAKQCKPFGWKRSQGLGRLQDLFEIFHKFWTSDGPIDHDGNHIKLEKAYIGCGKPYRPEIWGLGGGPKLLDLTLTHADGMAATAPCKWPTAEHAHEEITEMKRALEDKGRDPEEFGFGIYCPVLVHDDEEVVEAMKDNAIVRWLAGILGRIHAGDWRKEGIEPAVPDDWTYFQKMTPYDMDDAFVAGVVEKSTRAIVEGGWFWGTPEKVGRDLNSYLDAGVNWVLPCDWTPLVLDAADVAENQLRRNIQICEALKSPAAATTQ